MNQLQEVQASLQKSIEAKIDVLKWLDDQMKPYLELKNITLKKLQDDLESDLGNLLLVDIKDIPTSKDFTFEKWINYIKEKKILFVDAQETKSN